MEKGKGSSAKSIFYTVMRPMLSLLIGEAVLLTLVILGSNMIGNLNRNSESTMANHVQHRADYLGETFQSWADLSRLSDTVSAATQQALNRGTLTLEDLESDPEACTPVLLDVMNELLTTLHAKRVSGIFLVFSTQDLSQVCDTDPIPAKTGVCIRDTNPASADAGLAWERAPQGVVQAMDIDTDDNWQELFTFPANQPLAERAFFLMPLRAAFCDPDRAAKDYGCWVPSAALEEHGTVQHGTTYSQPLTLEDGTVYGVLGVNILDSAMDTYLLNEELLEDGEGTYFLAVGDQSAESLSCVTPFRVRGDTEFQFGAEISLKPRGNQAHYQYTSSGGERYFISASEIALYGENALFGGEHWLLLGAVKNSELYAFANWVGALLIGALLTILVCGLIASYVAAKRMSTPIENLSREIQKLHTLDAISGLPQTGIKEIDHFSNVLTTLSRNVLDESTRFLHIIRLASAELGGFEVRCDENSVFVTDNFFPMLGLLPIPPEEMTVSLFRELMDSLDEELPAEKRTDQSTVYTVAATGGTRRYIRVNVIDMGQRQMGVAEDITGAILERLRVEHERDYDPLTGLHNRRAFYTQAEELFAKPELLKHAALVMTDLDNLKFINDNYGHAWGDRYLRQAAQSFSENTPKGTLVARVSGDEFYLLIYGFEDQAEIRRHLDVFYNSVKAACFVLPSGKKMALSASCGVAWYPEDSRDFQELMRYADFAMYQVKRNNKGSLAEFNIESFNEQTRTHQTHLEFRQLIDEQRVRFFFQPIVDARTGQVRAYEALMRTDFPTLPSPVDVLRVARELNMLQDVETLTMLNAPAAYKTLLQEGRAEPEALLFVNSLSNQAMNPEDRKRYIQEVEELRPRLVVEFTESEDLTIEALREKLSYTDGKTPFALDDYGTGYNSERNLLMLSPKYVKVDMAIIRDIDSDPDKQHIVNSLVSYAHNRKMLVVAEGIETMAELYKVLEMDVDLLQGFLLAKPGPVPTQIPEEIQQAIRTFQKTRCSENTGS